MREHGHRLGNMVYLQCDPDTLEWEVTLNLQRKAGEPQIRMGQGWSDFMAFNCIEEGDQLLFTLTADSVYVQSSLKRLK